MKIKIKIFSDFDSNIRSIWKNLEKKCSHYVFQSFEWNNAWYNTIGRNVLNMRPLIIVVKDNDSTVALFPFGLFKLCKIRVIKFMGGDQNDYNLPLISNVVSNKKHLEKIWNKILKKIPKHDIQLFYNLPEKINDYNNKILNIWNCQSPFSTYQAILPDSYDTFEKRISKKIINDTNRQIKRLKKLGALNFKISKNNEEYDLFFNEMIKQKRRRYNETGVKDHLSNKIVQLFYKNTKKLESIDIQMASLSLNGEIIATHWGVIYDKIFYFLLPTYKGGKWSRYSTGRILQTFLIKWAIKSGLKTFDFSIGDEAYKKVWCNQNFKIFKREKLITWRGIPFYLFLKIRFILKTNKYSRSIIMKLNKKLNTFLK